MLLERAYFIFGYCSSVFHFRMSVALHLRSALDRVFQYNVSAHDKIYKIACADSEDSDQTGRMSRLIRVFAGRTCHFVGFVMHWLKFLFQKEFQKGSH